jgi:hypothetical protein
MAFTNYSIIPSETVVVLDGVTASGVSMVGIPADVVAIQWYGLQTLGTIQYAADPVTGIIPDPGTFTDPDDYLAQTTEAEAIIDAAQNPVIYYFTEETVYLGRTYFLGQSFLSISVGHPAPPNTTTDVPPVVVTGQTLYWYNSAWVVSSFDPNLALAAAKTSLIQTVTQDGAAAVTAELGLYSPVQQITAPDINVLDTATYPGTTIGDFQTYIDDVVASATATINAATSTEDLYVVNPAEIPYTPATSGVISTGRGDLGPKYDLDMNPSTIVTWNSSTVDVADTELYFPATATSTPYVAGPSFNYDQSGNCFTVGNYTVQLRQVSTGFVLAEWECPLSLGGNVDVTF